MLLTEERLRVLLKPLQEGNHSIEYNYHYKMVSEFSRRLRSLESLYTEIYSNVTQVETQLTYDKH